MASLRDVYRRLSPIYREGAFEANIRIADRLSSIFPELMDQEEIAAREECRKNRQNSLDRSQEFYKTLSIFGRALYLTGFCIREASLGGIVNELDRK